jgi:predicted permease
MFASWVADCRFAARRLRAQPGYALLAVLTLALGVGGTAATYGVARPVLFDALPYPHQREVGVFWKKTDWTEEEFLHIRGRVPGFSQVALYRQRDAILRDDGGPARLVAGVACSAELFDVLGVGPMVGRGFRALDDVPGAEAVVVLSFGLWRELGGDPSVIGTAVTLDGVRRTVIGVMPKEFWFPDPSVRMWTSVPLTPNGRNWNSTLIGRVSPGYDVRAMATPVAQLVAMLDQRFDYPAQWDKSKDARITPLRDDFTRQMRPALLATLAAMALILLIACANVAALMLGQVDARSVELAVRSALGASRLRLTRSLMVEATLIATAAGVLGAALAWTGFAFMTRALPLGAWAESTVPDWRVFASALAIAAGATWLSILVPAVSLRRGDLRGVLSGARTGGVRGRGGHLENGLVIAQVALAAMIATGAALLGRTVVNLYAVDPGVRTTGVAVVDLVMSPGIPRSQRERTLEELVSTLTQLPGVRSAGVSQQLALRGGGYNMGLSLPDSPSLKNLTSEYRIITPGYLETAGFAVRQGRTIGRDDRRETDRVVVINEAMARKYFGGLDPIGKRIGGDADGLSRIVGVVADAAERQLTDVAVPVRYVAAAQMPWLDYAQSVVLDLAPGIDEAPLLEAARRAIVRIAPTVAVQQTTTMSRVLEKAVGPARQVVLLLSLLTALALTLGAVGVYGVVAHFAARRRRDWAIRVALGMPSARVVAHVLRHGVLLVAGGIGVGAVGAVFLARLLSSLLYGVQAIDPIAFAAAGAMLLGVGMVAAFIPAWRAGMTDPAIALREQ